MDEPSRRNGELLICSRCSRPFDSRRPVLPQMRCAPDHAAGRSRRLRARGLAIAGACTPARLATAIIVGTLAEIVIRRALWVIFRQSTLPPALRPNSTPAVHYSGDNGLESDAVIESETFAVRHLPCSPWPGQLTFPLATPSTVNNLSSASPQHSA